MLWLESEQRAWLAIVPLVKEPLEFLTQARADFDREIGGDGGESARDALERLAKNRGVA